MYDYRDTRLALNATKEKDVGIVAQVLLKAACVAHGSMLSYIEQRHLHCLDRSMHTLLHLQFSVRSNVSVRWRIKDNSHCASPWGFSSAALLPFHAHAVLKCQHLTREIAQDKETLSCSGSLLKGSQDGECSAPKEGLMLCSSAYLEERKMEVSSFSRDLFRPALNKKIRNQNFVTHSEEFLPLYTHSNKVDLSMYFVLK